MGESPSFTGEFIGETHRVLECTQTQPPRNQHQKGPIRLWEVGEMTESQPRAEQSRWHCSLLDPYPTHIDHKAAMWVARPGEYLRLHPLQWTALSRQGNMAQMEEEIRAPKIELSDDEIANLSDAVQNTGNQDAHRTD